MPPGDMAEPPPAVRTPGCQSSWHTPCGSTCLRLPVLPVQGHVCPCDPPTPHAWQDPGPPRGWEASAKARRQCSTPAPGLQGASPAEQPVGPGARAPGHSRDHHPPPSEEPPQSGPCCQRQRSGAKGCSVGRSALGPGACQAESPRFARGAEAEAASHLPAMRGWGTGLSTQGEAGGKQVWDPPAPQCCEGSAQSGRGPGWAEVRLQRVCWAPFKGCLPGRHVAQATFRNRQSAVEEGVGALARAGVLGRGLPPTPNLSRRDLELCQVSIRRRPLIRTVTVAPEVTSCHPCLPESAQDALGSLPALSGPREALVSQGS